MTLEQKKETVAKILTVLDGLTYADAYSILGWTQDKLAINSFVSAHYRDSANEIMQTVEDNLPELADKIMGHFAEQLSRYSPPSIKER